LTQGIEQKTGVYCVLLLGFIITRFLGTAWKNEGKMEEKLSRKLGEKYA
jgi:hypothetical protein